MLEHGFAPGSAGERLEERVLREELDAKLPIAADGWNITAREEGGQFVLRIDAPQDVTLDGDVQFFAASGPLIEYSAPQTTSVAGGVVTMRLARSPYLTGTPERISGVLLAANGGGCCPRSTPW